MRWSRPNQQVGVFAQHSRRMDHMEEATSIIGALLLTGYLGGAVATHVRAGSSLFPLVFPFIIGALVWGGLALRDERLRAPGIAHRARGGQPMRNVLGDAIAECVNAEVDVLLAIVGDASLHCGATGLHELPPTARRAYANATCKRGVQVSATATWSGSYR